MVAYENISLLGAIKRLAIRIYAIEEKLQGIVDTLERIEQTGGIQLETDEEMSETDSETSTESAQSAPF